MSRQKNMQPNERQTKLIEILNRRLADAIDLQLQSRQAYWNVNGSHSMILRELFDKVAQGVEVYADQIARQIVRLGGTAEGTAQAVARRTSLHEYVFASADEQSHFNALATKLTSFGKHVRYASEQASEMKDADMSDLFRDMARGIDNWLRFMDEI